MTQKVFEITRKDWATIGQLAIQLTRKDARKGIFQNNKNRQSYKSKDYARYKKNDMRKFGRGKNKIGAGERLKQYKGVSISSRNIRFVNLTLTGAMLNNMFNVPIKNGVIVSFAPADAGKVLGAEDNDRQVLGLRDENIKQLETYVIKKINSNIKGLKTLSLTITL